MTHLVRIDNTPVVLIAEDQEPRCSERAPWIHVLFLFLEVWLLAAVALLFLPGVAR